MLRKPLPYLTSICGSGGTAEYFEYKFETIMSQQPMKEKLYALRIRGMIVALNIRNNIKQLGSWASKMTGL